jgi:mannitol/fructose-specific phosphotransferase system IIA component (Ntr-type)
LRQLSAQAASKLGLDPDEVTERIAKREELGSTGVGNGVALLKRGVAASKRRSAFSPVCAKRLISRLSTTAG